MVKLGGKKVTFIDISECASTVKPLCQHYVFLYTNVQEVHEIIV